MLVALTGVSMPIFWLGLMLSSCFQSSCTSCPREDDFRRARVRADHQFGAARFLLRGDLPTFYQGLRHLALPAIALATIPMAIIARMTRSSMLEMLNQDYVRTAIPRA